VDSFVIHPPRESREEEEKKKMKKIKNRAQKRKKKEENDVSPSRLSSPRHPFQGKKISCSCQRSFLFWLEFPTLIKIDERHLSLYLSVFRKKDTRTHTRKRGANSSSSSSYSFNRARD